MKYFLNPDSPVMSFFGLIFDFIWLNILTLLLCLPVVTAGASITAMYASLIRVIRGNDTKLSGHFFSDFKSNFKKSTLLWLIFLAFGIVLSWEFGLVKGMKGETAPLVRILLLVISAFLLAAASTVFLLQSHFENTISATLRNGFTLAIARFPAVLLSTLIEIFLLYFLLRYPVQMIFLFIGCGFTFAAYIEVLFLNSTLWKLEGKDPDEEKKRMKGGNDSWLPSEK